MVAVGHGNKRAERSELPNGKIVFGIFGVTANRDKGGLRFICWRRFPSTETDHARTRGTFENLLSKLNTTA